MTKADAVVIAAIETSVPSLVEARTLIDRFHDMIRKKDEAKLDAWIANAKASLVSSFATGRSSRTSLPCALRSRSLGQTAKSKRRLRNSNSSNDKCMGVQNLTFSKHDCSARRDPRCVIKYASDPNFDPFERRVLTVALASSELAGVAETWRARVA